MEKVALTVFNGRPPDFEWGQMLILVGERGYIETIDGSTRPDVTGASEWMLYAPGPGAATVDAGASAVGSDGTNLDLQYMRKLIFTPRVMSIFSGTPGSGFDFGE